MCSIFGVGKFFRDERQGLKKGGEKRKGSLLVFWKERCVSHFSHYQLVPSGDPTVRRKEREREREREKRSKFINGRDDIFSR